MEPCILKNNDETQEGGDRDTERKKQQGAHAYTVHKVNSQEPTSAKADALYLVHKKETPKGARCFARRGKPGHPVCIQVHGKRTEERRS